MAAEPTPLSGRRTPPPPPSENAAAKTVPVWNKPSGDAVCHVIADDDTWPALSECTKNPSRSSVVFHPPPVSASQGALSSNPKKNRNQNPKNHNVNQNHKHNANPNTMPAKQRPKRGGGGNGNGPSQNGIGHHQRPLPLPRPPPPPPALATPSPPPLPPYPIYEGYLGPLPPPLPFHIPPSFNGNNWERRPVVGFAPQPPPVNDHIFQSKNDSRGNNGHMSRRDHHHDRNASHKGFIRPSRPQAPQAPQPPPPPFFHMPSIRPFSNPSGFDMASPYVNLPPPPPEFFMRFPQPLPLFIPPIDPALPSRLIRQIDHYFSDDNLAKDSFLRARMDDEGWVDIAFVAAFPMVQRMTQNIQLILDSLKDSTVIEVQGALSSNPKKNRNQNPKNHNVNQNHKHNANPNTMPAKQRPKRGGGGNGNGPSQNGIGHHQRPLPLPRPPPPPPALATPSPPPLPPYPIYEGYLGPLPPPLPFHIPPSFNGNNWERRPVVGFAPQPPPVNDHIFQSKNDSRGNNGHMSRRDHHHDRNASHKGFIRPSRPQAPQAPQPPPPPFFHMPSIRPFSNPSGFDMASPYVNLPPPPPEFFMRFPQPLPLFIPPIDPALPSRLIRQIDHYFSDDNLAKDSFLRARMDDEGWVDIAFVAAFPMVQRMTQNIQLILDSLKDSTVIEVQGNLIRRRNDWKKWILSVPRSPAGPSSPSHVDPVENTLSDSFKDVTLEDETNSNNVASYEGKAVSSSNAAHSDVAN